MSKRAADLLRRLEFYEQCAYDNEHLGGSAWLEKVGEEFTTYVRRCAENNKSATMSGFVLCIDKIAKELELTTLETCEVRTE